MIDELVLWKIDALAVIGYTICWFFSHRWFGERKSLVPQILLTGGVSVWLFVWPLLPWVGGSFFGSVRMLAWFVFVGFPALLISYWWQRRSRRALLLSIFLIAVGVNAFWIEPQQLEVKYYQLSSSKIKQPIRLALLADIQTDHIGKREHRVLKRAMQEQPDLLLFAGDYVQATNQSYARESLKFNQMLQETIGDTPGVAVEGDIDEEDWPALFTGTNIISVRNSKHITLNGLLISALSWADSSEGSKLKSVQSEQFQLMLGHKPDFSLYSPNADLLLAGHTHGGQVQLPFIGPLVTLSNVPRAHAEGQSQVGSSTLIVSRGIGTEQMDAPRLRFLCWPELSIIELVPEQQSLP